MKKLPLYRIVIDEDLNEETGVYAISFVNEPAIAVNWVHFSQQKEIQLSIQDEDQRIVTGAILIPDLHIYRNDGGKEYNMYITKEEIKKVVLKYFRTNKLSNVDVEHSGNLLNGITLFESFITDKARGINPPSHFEHLPDGTWFASFRVDSDTVWNNIKAGKVNGFSIAGLFFDEEAQLSAQPAKEKSDLQIYHELLKLINSAE